ncbi:MAG: hypothetical protein KGD59_14370 [Candidatus Heimdallarchaeota archaeon]|nr:hypothetical protein [Candidatus Heimdallarchaeota archaeon]MBY8995732.1 hypothetical protein [Candidatus Heimdallarchaeota archaeon]
MTTEQTTVIENPNMSAEISSNLSSQKLKSKLGKIFAWLKPTILNSVITFIVFICVLAVTKLLGITIAVTFGTYILVSFFLQPILEKGLGKKLNILGFGNSKNKTSLIRSNNQSITLFTKKNFLIGISLLSVEWITNFVNLSSIWDFLQDEGIQIQDCREGCFFVIRKKCAIKKSSDLQEQATKLVKEIERTILLMKKKFDLDYENLNLHLVKGQERILMILNIGLDPEKFDAFLEISEDEIDYIKNSTLEKQEQKLVEKQLLRA